MSLYKKCRGRCPKPERCNHSWYYRIQADHFKKVDPETGNVLDDGRRFGSIDQYAAWHRKPEDPQHRVRTKSEAKDWHDAIKVAMAAGIDPRIEPVRPASVKTVESQTIEQYIQGTYTPDYVDIADLTLDGREDKRSKLRVLVRHVGALPVEALLTDEPIKKIRTVYANNEVSTKNRYLGALNALINWAIEAGHLTGTNPFRRKANKINAKAEAERDRRLVEGEEEALFNACEKVTTTPRGTHKLTWEIVKEVRRCAAFGEMGKDIALRFGLSRAMVSDVVKTRVWNPERERASGLSMQDRIIGGLDTCCRISEMALIQNKNVNWVTGLIGIPKSEKRKNPKTGKKEIATKGKMARWIPFKTREGNDISPRLTAILERRRALGPEAYVFGEWAMGHYVADWTTTWYVVILFAHGKTPKWTRNGGFTAEGWQDIAEINLHWHDLRHEGLSRYADGALDPRDIQLLAGHKKITTTMRYLHQGQAWRTGDGMAAAVKERERRLRLVRIRKTGQAEGTA